jgi:hypothetical protein
MKKAPAKKATKKAATKKTAKVVGFTGGFDILSPAGAARRNEVMEDLRKISERRTTKPTNFRTMAEVRSILIPVDHFALQYGLGSRGIPFGSFVQLLGGSGLGKSTLGHLILGSAMRHCKGPALSIQWRAKPFLADRAIRALSNSPEQARHMLDVMDQSVVSTLQQMELTVDDYVRVWREDHRLPKAIPITILVDNASKLMNAEEAHGQVDWGDHMKPQNVKKAKETGGGSNMNHAKWFEAWTRKLGYLMPENNVTIIAVLDQKDEVDMSGGSGPTMAKSTTDLFNTTHRGGSAIRQMSMLAINFAYKSLMKDAATNTERGKIITMRPSKNCVGAEGRRIEAELRTDHVRFDRPGYLDPAWHFDKMLADMFAEKGYFGVTCNRQRFTSERLGVMAASEVELSIAFHSRPELMQELGQQLRLEGYYDIIDRMLEDYATPPQVGEEKS